MSWIGCSIQLHRMPSVAEATIWLETRRAPWRRGNSIHHRTMAWQALCIAGGLTQRVRSMHFDYFYQLAISRHDPVVIPGRKGAGGNDLGQVPSRVGLRRITDRYLHEAHRACTSHGHFTHAMSGPRGWRRHTTTAPSERIHFPENWPPPQTRSTTPARAATTNATRASTKKKEMCAVQTTRSICWYSDV